MGGSELRVGERAELSPAVASSQRELAAERADVATSDFSGSGGGGTRDPSYKDTTHNPTIDREGGSPCSARGRMSTAQRIQRTGGLTEGMIWGGINPDLHAARQKTAFEWKSSGTADDSNLHQVCRCCPSLTELRSVFRAAVEISGAQEACSKIDLSGGGRLPLHCIGLNRELILMGSSGAETPSPHVEAFVLEELLPAHPAAVIEEDDKGRIPFTEVIYDWVRSRRAVRKWKSLVEKNRNASKLRAVAIKLIGSLSNTSGNEINKTPADHDDDDSSAGSVFTLHSDKWNSTDKGEWLPHGEGRASEKRTLAIAEYPCEESLSALARSMVEQHEENEGQDHLSLPAMVEWSLIMLSRVIEWPRSLRMGSADTRDSILSLGDSLNGSTNHKLEGPFSNTGMAFGSFYSDVVVEKVASIPYLVQELLLIKDKAVSRRVFHLSIVRRILLCKNSFGNGLWFTRMLIRGSGNDESIPKKNLLDAGAQSKGRSVPSPRDYAEGAVFYLERISDLNPLDDTSTDAAPTSDRLLGNHVGRRDTDAGLMRNITSGEIKSFRKKYDALCDALVNLEGLDRRLIVLDDDLLGRAAVTSVVQRVIDKTMLLPCATTMLFFDFIYHILVIVAFRLGPAHNMLRLLAKDEHFNPHAYICWWLVLLQCCMYFIARETNQAVAKYFISPRLFWDFSFWNLVDFISLFLVVTVSIAVDWRIRKKSQVGWEENETHFLLLAIALATGGLWLKLLGVIKMLNRHLATFVLCLFEIMKDIKWFLLVLSITMAAFAQMFATMMYGSKAVPDSTHLIYFRAYTVMLGDFDSTNFSTGFLSFLFTLYTFIVTIVLLNILIAIVSSSYDKSMVSSKILFGKSRLLFVADLMSLHTNCQLMKEGELSRWALHYLCGSLVAFAAICTKMVADTAKSKVIHADQSMASEVKNSDYPRRYSSETAGNMISLEAEATLFFVSSLFVSFIALKIRMASYAFSEKLICGSNSNKLVSAVSSLTGFLKHFVFMIQSFVLEWLDYSEEENDSMSNPENLSGHDDSNPCKVGSLGLKSAMKSIRKEIKSESKHFQQEMMELEERLQSSLMESEERIASMIAASENRITSALAGLTEKQTVGNKV